MDSTIFFRKARRGDRWEIRRLVWSARLNPTGLKWQRFTVGITARGSVIACAQIKPHRDGSQELASVVVSPDCRGQGIARRLLKHLIQNHQGDLYLMCRNSMGDFYRKFGFIAATEEELSPYFSRISRLASLIKRRQDSENGLLVMKLNPSNP